MRDENVSTNVVIGDLGAESALLVESADREDLDLIAASDNLVPPILSQAAAASSGVSTAKPLDTGRPYSANSCLP
jgi:hypothetical protein